MEHPLELAQNFESEKDRLMAAVKAGDFEKIGKAIGAIVNDH